MDATATISLQALSKQYAGSDRYALRDLSLQVFAGEIYGFLGPNGAGKSTAIRILVNLLQPTSGRAQILGHDVVTESMAIKQQLGYLPGDFAVYPKMTGLQLLTYLDKLQGGGNLAYARKLAKEFRADLHKRLGELSRGNRQKIGLIQALMHQPAVLILDEPTSGLDPLMQEKFQTLLIEAKQRQSTIFLSSHILGEVQKMCDRVGIIREGKLIAEQVIADLAKEAIQTFELRFASYVPIAELKRLRGLKITHHHDQDVTVHYHGKLTQLLKLLSTYDVQAIDTHNLDLEELFMHYYASKESKV